jgi:hypothetical protein
MNASVYLCQFVVVFSHFYILWRTMSAAFLAYSISIFFSSLFFSLVFLVNKVMIRGVLGEAGKKGGKKF